MSSILYQLLLLITAGYAVYRWELLSNADRWICVLLCLTLVQECIAGHLLFTYRNNFFTYHIYTPIELFVIVNYFVRSIGLGNSEYTGVWLGIAGIMLSLINSLLLQSFYQINSYYLLFEGLVVLGFCLISFYRLLIKDDVVPGRMVHFWITICFLFYWSLTYANLGLYGAQVGKNSLLTKIFDVTLYSANLLFYFGIALVFVRYKKLIPSGE
jgi:hypothetical protein